MLIAIFITYRSENLAGKETRLEDERKPAQSSKIKLAAIFHKVHAQTGTLDDPGSFTNHEHPVDATYGSAEPARRNTQQPRLNGIRILGIIFGLLFLSEFALYSSLHRGWTTYAGNLLVFVKY